MSHAAADLQKKVVPAQLGFLAIYNPSLGTTDETLDDQIVYYSTPESRQSKSRRGAGSAGAQKDTTNDEKNTRLRQIGLAQGMVEFSKTFSEGKPVDTIETDKSRIVLHELEAGWWILASIDLTRLRKHLQPNALKSKDTEEDDNIEYSAREVKPAALLLQDLLRAHSIFLLHHASSISALFVRNRRPKFVNTLGRYWDAFLSTWSVMLHGNPAVAIYGGIKLSGSGELGIGVGEEHRGSGEREVLEGFVPRIEGLVDLVVSKFGDAEPTDEIENSKEAHSQRKAHPWLGTGAEPGVDDGAIFLGIGALSRKSLRDVTYWMEDLYSWGPRAYGVMDNPTSTRKMHKKKRRPETSKEDHIRDQNAIVSMRLMRQRQAPLRQVSEENESPAISPEAENLPGTAPTTKPRRPSFKRSPSSTSSTHSTTGGKIASYFKLGYGTHWSLGSGSTTPSSPPEVPKSTERVVPKVEGKDANGSSPDSFRRLHYPDDDSVGHYLVGLMGDIEAKDAEDTDQEDTIIADTDDSGNPRTLLRTVTVELEREGDARAEADISIDLSTTDGEVASSKHGSSQYTGTSHASFESQDRNKTKRLRVLVYVMKPFIFTLLFELRTDALALPSFYRSVHRQLSPLQRPLLNSTQYKQPRPDSGTSAGGVEKTPIYDLIWDPKELTISSTIPNIPESGHPAAHTAHISPWSRMEALNTHTQLLNTYTATRSQTSELERTCKTSRGYWVVWTRIPDPDASRPSTGTSIQNPAPASQVSSPDNGSNVRRRGTSQASSSDYKGSIYSGPAHPFLEVAAPAKEYLARDKEIFLVRRASDYVASYEKGRFASVSSMAGDGPARLAQGIGVDTKRYIESLLELSR